MGRGKGIALVALVAALFMVGLVLFFGNEGMTPGGIAEPTNEPAGPDLLQ